MMKILAVLILCGAVVSVAAAPPVVGVAQGNGDLRIDNAAVSGNGTLFDGSVIETGPTRSELTLSSGSSLTLVGRSRAKVFSDRLELEPGGAEVRRTSDFEIAAQNLRITPSHSGARVQVAVDDDQAVRVAALQGEAEVRSGAGVLVARVRPGMALALRPQPENSTARVTGIVRQEGNRFLLTDETTNVTVELRGDTLMLKPGTRIEAVGTILEGADAGEGVAHVIEVETASPLGPAPGTMGQGAAGAGTAKGISGGTIAILSGIGAAGTIGTLYATDVIGDGEEESSVSR